MRVLGIDPGLRNCGVCVVEGSRIIVQWVVIDTDPQSAQAMIAALDAAGFPALMQGVDGVAVERQPPKNAQMLKCMYFLESYVAHRFPSVWYTTVTPQKRHAFVRASGGGSSSHTSSSYVSRKKASVDFVTSWLEGDEHGDARAILARHDKKDDLCESFLVALIASQRRDQK